MGTTSKRAPWPISRESFRVPEFNITRCVCAGRTFTSLQSEGHATIEGIGEATGAGTHCTLCRPFLSAMLRTGRTAFRVDEEVSEHEGAPFHTDDEPR